MGLLDYINKAVDKVDKVLEKTVTTVTEMVTTQSTPEVSKTKENIPMVSKKTQAAQKNEDKVEIKNKGINTIYKQIEDLCSEYKMNMEDVKNAQLLETIAGCSSEELVKKSQKEIKSYIDSLKFVLKYQSFTFFWQDRNIDDVKNIAKKANKRYIYLQTGGDFLDNLLRREKSLGKRMKEAGFEEVNAENTRQYFTNMLTKAIATKDSEKIKKAYNQALKEFGYILNDTENPDEKALLTAAISELEASKRNLAAKLSITSCQNNTETQIKVAKGISDNYRAMTCSADALGQFTSDSDNIEISQTSFQYMSEEDSLNALAETKSYISNIEAKIKKGEALSAEEERFYGNVRYNQYAGAMIGASCNSNYPSPNNVLMQIDNDTAEQGIRDQVYNTASTYLESHQDKLPITTQQFTKIVDTATDNHYSNIVTNSSVIEAKDIKTHQIQNQQKSQTQAQSQTQNTITKTSTNASIHTTTKYTVENETTSSENTVTTNTKSPIVTGSKLPAIEQRHTTHAIETESIPGQKTESASFEQAVKGGVKSVKKYAKTNNIKTIDLAIDSLNSSFASHATKKWALSQFENASNSEQLLKFNKITNGASAHAAAKTMDENTRRKLNTFRSYYIKQTVENLENGSST